MSEFSGSYHLQTERTDDAIELLRRAKLKGYGYAPTNGWVTFVAENAHFEADARIIGANTRRLVHFVSAEDHGWGFTIYDAAKRVCAYRCDWDDEVVVGDSAYAPSVLEDLISQHGSTTLAAVEAVFHPASLDDVNECDAARTFADAIGLEHYEWLDYSGLAREFDRAPAEHLDVWKVE